MQPFDIDVSHAQRRASTLHAGVRGGPDRLAHTRGLLIALALSVALHAVVSLWPAELPATPEAVPLQATITTLPPPPAPAVKAAPAARAKPRRATAPPAPAPEPEPVPVATSEPEPRAIEPTADAVAMGPEPPAEPVEPAPAAAAAELPPKMLPPRVDLVYKAFLGTHGFLVGEAAYRFEHAANEYRITTIGEAKGLAAIFVRGQGKLESRGLITSAGLQPLEFAVERGSRERRETAVFDWEAGVVTLHEQKTAALELPTFDPLALMWQAYFSPPDEDTQSLNVATTRRVASYTITREGRETIALPQGATETERWHRKSDDGKSDTYVWLAPSLHYVPVKIRVRANFRGIVEATLEAVLDSIRVDEAVAPR